MWRTSQGDRVLRGPEWDLFREGLSSLWDRVEDWADGDDDFGLGVKAFDRLAKNQKLALLLQVGRALKDEAVPAPELTSSLEAAVATVFEKIREEIAMEIDGEKEGLCFEDDPLYWRRLVRAASKTVEVDEDEGEGGDALPPSSPDHEAWSNEVDFVSNLILWEDGDYEMEDEFLDDPPEVRLALMAQLRIAEDYYTAVAPDPRDEEMPRIRAGLMELCERRKPV